MADYPKGITLDASYLEKFRRILKEEEGKPISIIVARVDPDGTGSAKGMKFLVEALGYEAKILAGGTVGHPQNLTIYETFDLGAEIFPLTSLPAEGLVILVDSSKFVDSRIDVAIDQKRIRIVIDHHQDPQTNNKGDKDRFIWIAPVGAAATLVSMLIEAHPEAQIDEKVATQLALGIHTDTEELASLYTTDHDRMAFAKLMRIGSQEDFHKCSKYLLPARCKELLLKTITNATEIDEFWLAHPDQLLLGNDGDYLSIFAHRLLRHEGPHTAIVWGVTGNEVRVSVRTRSPSLNLCSLMDDLFGKGNGGAKHGSGGASIPLKDTFVPTERTASRLISLLSETYIEKLERRVGVKKKERIRSE